MRSLLGAKAVGFLTIALGLVSHLTNAHAEIELAAVGGANFASPIQRSSNIDIRSSGNPQATFGLLAGIQLFDSDFTFETGILSIPQQTERDDIIPTVATQMKFIQIPFLVRYKIDETFGLGLGLYTAFALGNVSLTQNNFTTEIPYETLFMNKTDIGMLLNARARFAISAPIYLIADLRYQFGFTNLSQNLNDTYQTRSFQAMVGVMYQLDTSPSPNHLE